MPEPARKLRALASTWTLALLLPLAAPAAPQAETAWALGDVTTPAEAEAGTLLLRTAEGLRPAPTLHTDVAIRVTGMIARAEVTQRFANPAGDWVEGVYVFPLPTKAAVDTLRMVVGERVIEGEIQTREEAKRTYAKAKREGRKASLLEQERPNVFTTSVANIGPGEEIEVVIHYQEDLRYDQGRFSLRFPMVVGPRYVPGATKVAGFAGTGWAANTDQVPDAARITPPVAHPSEGLESPVAIEVELDTGFPLPVVTSPSHPVAVRHLGGDRYGVRLAAGRAPADSDFVLEWRPEVGTAPEAALFTEERDGEHYVLLMVMPPNGAAKRARLARETIFVIDTSGSMNGASIQQARDALVLALGRLRAGDRFNVIQFNSAPSELFPMSVPAEPGSVRQAVDWVRGLGANGGTEMLPALRAALEGQQDRGLVRQVIFVTDGSVGNEAALFRNIEGHLGKSRLFTVGIGSAPNSHFMTKAAEYGRGTFTHVGSSGEVQEKMGELFAKLESPVLSEIRMDWEERSAEPWPRRIPDLYLGEPVVVTAKLPKLGGELVLDGKRGDVPFRVEFPVQGGAKETGIGRLWARRKVAALMGSLHDGADAAEVRHAVADLGLRFHLVTKYTSLVAVDVTPTAPVGVEPDTRAVPTRLPKGWQHESVFGRQRRPVRVAARTSQGPAGLGGSLPQTATPALLLVLLGSGGLGAAALLRRATRRID